MNRVASGSLSPLWIENDISSFEERSVVVSPESFEVSNLVQGKISPLCGALCHLGDVEKGLENYSSLSLEDREGLNNVFDRVKQVIEKHKFECIETRFNKVARDFEKRKIQDRDSDLLLDIEFLEANFSTSLEKITEEVPDVYKGICEYFKTLNPSKLTSNQAILLNKFEPIHYQIAHLIKDSLQELDFVAEALLNILDKKTSEKEIALIKQEFEIVTKKIQKLQGFMNSEDQSKANTQLVEIETDILFFESRTSPSSVIDALEL